MSEAQKLLVKKRNPLHDEAWNTDSREERCISSKAPPNCASQLYSDDSASQNQDRAPTPEDNHEYERREPFLHNLCCNLLVTESSLQHAFCAWRQFTTWCPRALDNARYAGIVMVLSGY
ncbi:hypothetical protein M758_4G258600 [Ceratodon purpureus]|nr:hypothetical protein M758_4G258600 [Ceratodon purpureus]